MDKMKNPWEQKKKVHLPKAIKGEEEYVYVSVNERTFQVPKGMEVEVPLPVYARLMIMQAAQAQADAYVRQLAQQG